MAKYTEKFKNKVLDYMYEKDITVAQAARKFKVSRPKGSL